MISFSKYWPESGSEWNSRFYTSRERAASEARMSSEERSSSSSYNRARTVSPSRDRSSRSVSVTRKILDFSGRPSRAISVPSRTIYEETEPALSHTQKHQAEDYAQTYAKVHHDHTHQDHIHSQSHRAQTLKDRSHRAHTHDYSLAHSHPHSFAHSHSTSSSYHQVLSSHDVLSKPFYRSFYYIRPRPDPSLYKPRSTEEHETKPMSRIEPVSYYRPYTGRYYSRYNSPIAYEHHHYYNYPYVSSALFLPRYYPGSLSTPYVYAYSRFQA